LRELDKDTFDSIQSRFLNTTMEWTLYYVMAAQKTIRTWSLSSSSAKCSAARCHSTTFHVKGGRREREAFGQNHLFFSGAMEVHLIDAVQNINELGRRKWALSASHLDTQYLE